MNMIRGCFVADYFTIKQFVWNNGFIRIGVEWSGALGAGGGAGAHLICDVWGSLGFGQCAVCVLLKLPSVADCLLFQPVQCVALEHWALCPLVSGVVHLLVPLPCLAMLTSVQGMHLETTIVQSGLHIRATDYGLNNI